MNVSLIKYNGKDAQCDMGGHSCDFIRDMTARLMSDNEASLKEIFSVVKAERAADQVQAALGTKLAVAQVADTSIQTVGSVQTGGIGGRQ